MLKNHLAWIYAILFFLLSWSSWAKPAPLTSIHVTLLGQPCVLQGSLDEETLKKIHAVGPAQMPVLSASTPIEAKKAALKVIDHFRTHSLPPAFDAYREQVLRRLKIQVIFFEAMEALKRTPGTAASLNLTKIGKTYLQGSTLKAYESQVSRLATLKAGTDKYKETANAVFESFNDGLGAEPDKYFHRAIKQMNLEYNCTFEESDEETP